MLNVNTIEFNGRKACINSYSDLIHTYPQLMADMNNQREEFAKRFPNATVRTERMTELETIKMVAADNIGHLRNNAWEIGQASEGK